MGKESLVAALKEHLRTAITTDQADRMWNAVRDRLATLFYERGREVLLQISTLLGEETDHTPQDTHLVVSLADAAAGAFEHPDQQAEVRTAIRDIVLAGEADTVHWLTRAAYGFVCACAMGLEDRTRAALEDVVGRTALVFDTDVVLSYLSPDEPAHIAAKAIRDRWRSLGGRVFISEEVASEVAYHAWIAQTDASHYGPHLLKTPLDRQILSRNAFVRGFASLLAAGKARQNQWSAWIAQYRGKERHDSAVTRRTLTQDHSFGILPAPSGEYRTLAKSARDYLSDQERHVPDPDPKDEHESHIRRDKAKRDASLFASTVQLRERTNESDTGGSTFLLSSSTRFRRLEQRLRPNDGSLVLTIPAALYLLSMAPERGLGLTALKGFIFDETWQERVSDFHLSALRVVRSSKEIDMPWAKRRSLLNALDDRACKIAADRATGRAKTNVSKQAIREVQSEWLAKGGKSQFLRELVDALDTIAADRRDEVELVRAREEISNLKRQLEAERAKRRD